MLKFSIVIPAYNESNRIVKSLEKIKEYFKNKNEGYEVIVVNDGSKDDTLEVLKGISKNYGQLKVLGDHINRGKGYAVKTGVLNSHGKYVLFSDADLSTPIEELDNLYKFIEDGYEVILGSRNIDIGKVKIKQPPYRRFLGNILRIYHNIVVFHKNPPSDTQCGFKLFTRKAAYFLFNKQKINGGMFDIEIIYLARKYKMKVMEVPVVWINDPDSKINLVKCIIFDPIDLIKIRINDLFGKYKK
jgi:dolichyl-phosphate beta-glucosyltransferase